MPAREAIHARAPWSRSISTWPYGRSQSRKGKSRRETTMTAHFRPHRPWSLGLLAPALFACGDTDLPTQPEDSPTPAAIDFVSGNDQQGKAGERLSEPFVVWIGDSRGQALADVDVEWRVTSGAGEWVVPSPPNGPAGDEHVRGAITTTTDADGLAKALFRPTALGTTTVHAEVSTVQGLDVAFTASASEVVIHVRFLSECTGGPSFFTGPDGTSDVTVPVGTPVEWVLGQVVSSCAVQIASLSSPPGGGSFDSGRLSRGDRFRFIPDRAGSWEYVDRFHGARGTLTVR